MALPVFIPSPSTGVVHLGPFPLRAYALCIIVGVLAGTTIGQRRAAAKGIRAHAVADMAVWAVPAGIIGARIYHVITSPDAYFGAGGHPWQALAIWKGGLGIWGGVAAGAAAGWVWCRRNGIDPYTMVDACAPGIAVAQAIGRLGNYFNQELFGRPTSLPWGLEIEAGRPGTVPGAATYHPTFLYELLWCLVVAGLCVLAGRRLRLHPGQLLCLYVGLYTLGRAPIEALRIDDAHRFFGLRLNDYVAIAVLLGASVASVLLGRRPLPAPADRPTDPAAPVSSEAPAEVSP